MKKIKIVFENFYLIAFSEKTKRLVEHSITTVAIFAFFIHLILILLSQYNIINLGVDKTGLLDNPGMILYTPFSIILLYEIYLLVYYLPKSTSNYISKQYEIITLIVIRRIFKDISKIDLNSSDWFANKFNIQFSVDLVTTVVLFGLLYIFHSLNRTYRKKNDIPASYSKELIKYIKRKRVLGAILIPILVATAIYSFSFYIYSNFIVEPHIDFEFTNINKIFYHQFFSFMIITDVLLLLLSFYYTDVFYKVMRNSGYIISTILLRLSFNTTGIMNNALIITAIVFGLIMLFIHNKYEKMVKGKVR